ncbi:MAG: HEAT repeat domain-containing protein [Planctomycetota bacterium]
MSRRLLGLLLSGPLWLAPAASGQVQYRGPSNEVVSPTRLRAAEPTQGHATHTTNARPIYDIEGRARWEFWWEHNRDEFLWERAWGPTPPPEADEGSLASFFGPWARGQFRRFELPTDADVEKRLIPALLRALSVDDDTIKRQAIVALGKSAHIEAETHIAPFLGYSDPGVQKSAVLALGMLPTSSSFYRLAKLFVDEEASEEIRCWAAVALGLQGDPRSARLLMDRLTRHLPEYAVHRNFEHLTESTILALGLSNKRSVSPFLISVLDKLQAHPIQGGRLEAAVLGALGRLDDSAAVPRIVRALVDERIIVRRAAALAVQRHVSEPHRHILESLLRSDPDQQTRSFAALALGRLGGGASREFLVTQLRAGQSNSTRSFCALALGILADADSVPALLPFLEREQPRTLRAATAVGLGLIRDRRAIEPLRLIVKSSGEHPDLRGYAALGLGLVGDRSSCSFLCELLLDEKQDEHFRRSAALSLGLIGNQREASTLLKALQESKSSMVIGALSQSLGLLHARGALTPLRDVLVGQVPHSASARAGAAAALGFLGDPGRLPELARLSIGFNYRDRRPVLEEMLEIL